MNGTKVVNGAALEHFGVKSSTGNVMRDGVCLPSIVIEARSVGGNRKACEKICAALAQEATRLFGVEFDQRAVAEDGVLFDPHFRHPIAQAGL